MCCPCAVRLLHRVLARHEQVGHRSRCSSRGQRDLACLVGLGRADEEVEGLLAYTKHLDLRDPLDQLPLVARAPARRTSARRRRAETPARPGTPSHRPRPRSQDRSGSAARHRPRRSGRARSGARAGGRRRHAADRPARGPSAARRGRQARLAQGLDDLAGRGHARRLMSIPLEISVVPSGRGRTEIGVDVSGSHLLIHQA